VAETKNTVSRRGFIGKLGAAVAVTVLPGAAFSPGPDRPAAVPTIPAQSWAKTLESWEAAVKGAHVPAFRAAYVAEVERFAETLRPRFESGELRGFTDEDLEHEGEDREWKAPQWVLADLCVEHFKIEDMDPITVRLLVEASPHGEATSQEDWHEDCDWFRVACCWDVLAVAQARGMYVPSADEEPDPLSEDWCACGHRAAWHTPDTTPRLAPCSPSGCPVVGCDCARLNVVGIGPAGRRIAQDMEFA
jgi:hypothetical protein